ncbi:MAG: cell division protein SepF [Aquihabitans sp.]
MWRKAMIHLGLGDDADYEEYPVDRAEDADDGSSRDRGNQVARHQPPAPKAAPSAVSVYADDSSAIGAVHPINTRGSGVREQPEGGSQTVTPSGMGSIRPRPQVVRPVAMTANAKPHVVVPASFNQAQDVADKFKNGQPVIMNLQAADRDLSRRLIDFASGLCYGIGGQMERLVNQVYLLTPSNVEVSAEERRRIHERGYDS